MKEKKLQHKLKKTKSGEKKLKQKNEKMVKNCQTWSKIFKNGLKQSTMVNNCQTRSKIVKNGKRW